MSEPKFFPVELCIRSDQEWEAKGLEVVKAYTELKPPIEMADQLISLTMILAKTVRVKDQIGMDEEALGGAIQSVVIAAFNLGFEKGWWQRGLAEGFQK